MHEFSRLVIIYRSFHHTQKALKLGAYASTMTHAFHALKIEDKRLRSNASSKMTHAQSHINVACCLRMLLLLSSVNFV